MKASQVESPGLAYRDGRAWLEGVDLSRLYRAVGPCYVQSAGLIRARVRQVREEFGPFSPLLAYAVKANPSQAVLRLLASEGCGAEVVSAVELRAALRAGIPPERVVFNGNGKSAAELDAALGARVAWINVDGRWEMPALSAAAQRAGHPIRALLRVNPDLDPQTHPHISTGLHTSKFGMETGEAAQLVREAAQWPMVHLCGLHAHLGSQIRNLSALVESLELLTHLGSQLTGGNFRMEALNLGGGFAVDYTGENPAPSWGPLVAGLGRHGGWDGCQLILEPGRFLVADAGLLLGEVLGVKITSGRRFVITNLAMTELIRPALYDAWHGILPLVPRAGDAALADVVGPVCESADFLARERSLPPLQAGDLLAVQHTGAYGSSMASNYNGRLRLPEVWVDADRATCTRRAEQVEDLERLECQEPLAWKG